MGLVDKIKQDVKKSGSNKGKFLYVRDGNKIRVRFLTDMDEGMEVKFHDSFSRGINVPCQEIFGRDCEYCDDEDLRTRSQYIWSVYNYETKEVQLFMYPVNNCSPIPSLMACYENYGTLTDRDYVISVSGKQQNKTFSIVPMDKNKFRNEKAKPFSEKAILKLLDKAYPDDNASDSDIDDDEDDEPKRKAKRPMKESKKSKRDVDEIDDEGVDFGDDEEEETDYGSMSAKELYKLCKQRKLDVEPKKKEKYYINALKEADEAEDDWSDSDEEDDWEEDDE